MKKAIFIILFFGFMGVGFYYGSQDDTYAYKFFSTPKRFPANEAARTVQDIWENGSLKLVNEGAFPSKVYAPTSNPEEDICEHYEDVESLKVSIKTDAAVSSSIADAYIGITAEIDCNLRGFSPLFLKQFCSESLSFFRGQHTVGNTTFSFQNILDGFPRSWYIDSADVLLRDGLSVVGVKPSQSDVKALGKYTFECSEF